MLVGRSLSHSLTHSLTHSAAATVSSNSTLHFLSPGLSYALSVPSSSSMSAPSTPRSRTATITHEHAIRVCVCGASGTVGSLTVHALAACGVNVAIRAACSASSLSSDVVNSYRSLYGGVDGAGGEGVEVVELDYQDVAGLERLLAGIDRVFVVLPWSRDLRSMFDNLLTAAKRANVNFVCKMSSAMALLNEQHDVKLPQFVADVSSSNNNTHCTPQHTARPCRIALTAALLRLRACFVWPSVCCCCIVYSTRPATLP